MRKWFFLASAVCLFTGGAIAADNDLRMLETGVDASPWEAVGRLDLAGSGFCTGALIDTDLVLTAAHCLYNKRTGQRIDHSQIEFLAGWRNGRAAAYRKIRRAVIHPNYQYDSTVTAERVRNDLAVLELERPIRNTTIKPFSTAARPRTGDHVGVVSYARDRSEAPSLQEVCEVLGLQQGVLVASCSVDFGSSGAPIFVFSEDTARIVSVVSAKADVDGEIVSLGTDLHTPLQYLRTELEQGKGFFRKALPTASRVLVQENSRGTGAKFVLPGQ